MLCLGIMWFIIYIHVFLYICSFSDVLHDEHTGPVDSYLKEYVTHFPKMLIISQFWNSILVEIVHQNNITISKILKYIKHKNRKKSQHVKTLWKPEKTLRKATTYVLSYLKEHLVWRFHAIWDKIWFLSSSTIYTTNQIKPRLRYNKGK